MKNNTFFRLVLLSTSFTFLMITLSLIDLAKNPVKNYELSIYSSTPAIFWISTILGLINGFLLTYLGVTDRIKRIYILGIFEILFVNSLVILLHILRNYIICMLRGDSTTYIGHIKDVGIYGNIGIDFYPLTSMLISQLYQISNLPVIALATYSTAIFYIFSVLSVYCLSKSIMNNEKYTIFAVISITPLFFAWFSSSIYYMLFSVFTLPLFFYLLINLEDLRFKVLIVIFCLIYPFFHPFISIVVFFYIIVSYLAQRYTFTHIKNSYVSLTLICLSLICLSSWFINQYAICRSLILIVENLMGMLAAPSASSQATYYSSKLGLSATINTILRLLADEIIYYCLTIMAIYSIVSKGNQLERKKVAPFIACFISGSLLLIFLFTFTFAHRPDRLLNLNFNMMLTPIFIAYLLYLSHKNRLKTAFLMSLILIASLSTYFSLYQSPLTMRPNDYMTLSEYHGANWIINNKNPLTKTIDLSNPIESYTDLIYGFNFRNSRKDLKADALLPDHFGFTSPFNSLFPIDQDRYLLLSTYSEEAYTNVWKDIQRFNTEDFKKVDECENVFKIFEDGGFKTYLIRN